MPLLSSHCPAQRIDRQQFRVLSALPPKADLCSAIVNVCFVPNADSCNAANASLLDHLVGVGKQSRWHGEAESLGRFEVDRQQHLRRKLDRQIARSSAVQDLVDERGGSVPAPVQIHAITGEPAGDDMLAISIDRRQPLRQCQRSDLLAVAEKQRALQHDHDAHAPARQHLQCALDLLGSIGVRRRNVDFEFAARRLELPGLRRRFRV